MFPDFALEYGPIAVPAPWRQGMESTALNSAVSNCLFLTMERGDPIAFVCRLFTLMTPRTAIAADSTCTIPIRDFRMAAVVQSRRYD